jgi:peptidoglycan hydrolase-like protein with peptidoglycan-binding domain
VSLPSAPPRTTATSLRAGAQGWPVFALQSALVIQADGVFGPLTHRALTAYQSAAGLAPDGVAGPVTQTRISTLLAKSADSAKRVPTGLARGMIESESGGYLAAVNWTVAGGVDCGIIQRRVLGPPFADASLRAAFDPSYALALALSTFLERAGSYLDKPWVGRSLHRAMLCAVLAHNWPAGASDMAARGSVSNPGARASWAPGTMTRQQWADFYIGRVTRYVTAWPA